MAEDRKTTIPAEEQALSEETTFLDTRMASGIAEEDAAHSEELKRLQEEENSINEDVIVDAVAEEDPELSQIIGEKMAAVEEAVASETEEDDGEEEPVAELEEPDAEKNGSSAAAASTRRRGMTNGQRRARRKMLSELNSDNSIIPVNKTLEAYTPQQERRKAIAELSASASNGMILTGTIMGVEEMDGFGEPCAKVMHSDCAVYIPASQLITPEMMPELPTNKAERSRQLRNLIERRNGAEIDFIVRQLSNDGSFAVASRLDAMNIKRASFYWRRDRNGNYNVREGLKVEARVQYANSNGVVIEVWGVDAYVRASECSWKRIVPRDVFESGEKILASLKTITREEEGRNRKLSVSYSIKDAYPNPNVEYFDQFKEGQRYRAIVTWVDDKGIFVMMGDYKHNVAVQARCIIQRTTREIPPVGTELDVLCTRKYEDDHFLTCRILGRYFKLGGMPTRKW